MVQEIVSRLRLFHQVLKQQNIARNALDGIEQQRREILIVAPGAVIVHQFLLFLSFFLSFLSFYLSFYLSFFLSFCLSVCLSVCLSFFLLSPLLLISKNSQNLPWVCLGFRQKTFKFWIALVTRR